MSNVFKYAAKKEARLRGVNGMIASEIYDQAIGAQLNSLSDYGVEETKKDAPSSIERLGEWILDEMYYSMFTGFSKQVRFIGRSRLLDIITRALYSERLIDPDFNDYCVKIWGMESAF